MAVKSIWKTLGVKRTTDRREIRRAYALKLKVTNPEDNPDGFKSLREAYERALAYADGTPIFMRDDIVVFKPSENLTGETVSLAPPVEARADTPVPHAMFYAARSRLEKVLRAPDATVDMRLKALNSVLESPSLEALDIRSESEAWMAQLLLGTSPQSDPLIESCIRKFKWHTQSNGLKTTYSIRRILARSHDLAYLERLKQPINEHHDAYQVLITPPKPQTFWKGLFGDKAGVKLLLEKLHSNHESLLSGLNAESLAYWQSYFAKPRLKADTRWAIILLPVLLGLEILFYCLGPEWRGLSLALLLPTSALLSIVLHHFAVLLPRHGFKQNWRLQNNRLLRFGWSAGIFILLVLAAIPASWPLIILIGAFATVVSIWVSVTGVPDQREASLPWQVRAFLCEAYIVLWWTSVAIKLPPLTIIQMSLALTAACFVSAFGRMALYPAWSYLPRVHRAMVLAFIAALAGSAAWLLWVANADPAWQPAAVSAVTMVVLVQRIPALSNGPWAFRLRWFTCIGLVSTHLHGGGEYLFLAGGFALVAWALVSVIEAAISLTRNDS